MSMMGFILLMTLYDLFRYICTYMSRKEPSNKYKSLKATKRNLENEIRDCSGENKPCIRNKELKSLKFSHLKNKNKIMLKKDNSKKGVKSKLISRRKKFNLSNRQRKVKLKDVS